MVLLWGATLPWDQLPAIEKSYRVQLVTVRGSLCEKILAVPSVGPKHRYKCNVWGIFIKFKLIIALKKLRHEPFKPVSTLCSFEVKQLFIEIEQFQVTFQTITILSQLDCIDARWRYWSRMIACCVFGSQKFISVVEMRHFFLDKNRHQELFTSDAA